MIYDDLSRQVANEAEARSRITKRGDPGATVDAWLTIDAHTMSIVGVSLTPPTYPKGSDYLVAIIKIVEDYR